MGIVSVCRNASAVVLCVAAVSEAPAALELGLEDASGSWAGTAERGGVGSMVAGVGDINGDGYGDFAATNIADAYQINSPDIRRGWVFFGSPNAPGHHADIEAASGASFAGESPSYAARAGDVNADGIEDLLLANYVQYPTIFLLYGSTNPQWGHEAQMASVANATFQGGGHTSMISGNVDFNGDGKSDFFVKTNPIAACGIYGRTNPPWGTNTNMTAATSMYLSPAAGSGEGCAFGVGDFNGDGYADMFGCGTASSPSAWRFLFGKAAAPNFDVPIMYSYLSTGGSFARERGDFDGDGRDDALHNGNGQWDKSTTLLWGTTASFGPGPFPHASWTSSAANMSFAQGTQWLGDVNGDGYDDFIVVQRGPSEDMYFSSDGYAWVVLGRSQRPSSSNAIESTAAIRLGPFDDTGGFREQVSATDWNGDGLMDILIGAGGEEAGEVANAGKVFIYLAGDYPAATWYNHVRRTIASGNAGEFGPSRAYVIPIGAGGPFACRVAYTDQAPASFPKAIRRTWEVDPGSASSHVLSFLYTDEQLSEAGVDESTLVLLSAPAASGPWTETPFPVQPANNSFSVDTPQTGKRWWAIAAIEQAPEYWIVH